MEPSSSKPDQSDGRLMFWLDRAALTGLVIGLAGYVVPFAAEGRLKWAFWLTLASTVLHVFTSHSAPAGPGAAP